MHLFVYDTNMNSSVASKLAEKIKRRGKTMVSTILDEFSLDGKFNIYFVSCCRMVNNDSLSCCTDLRISGRSIRLL
jgi:hypothetical protein